MEMEKIIDNPGDFEMALGEAKLNGTTHMFVSDRLLKMLTRGRPDKSVLYEGVRLYTSSESKKEMDALEQKVIM